MAQRAGVSVPVVSAYLRGSKSVRMSVDTRRRVAEAIEELGYSPNPTSRSTRAQRTNVMAVVVPELGDPVLADVLRGIYDSAEQRGIAIVLGDAGQRASGGVMLERLLAHNSMDGVIARRGSALEPAVLSDVAGRRIPVVFLDPEAPGDLHWLAVDDADGVQAATAHLIGLGHEQIDFLGGQDVRPDPSGGRRRYQGYVAALQSHGLAPRPPVLCEHAAEHGYEAFSTMVAPRVVQRRRDAPTALVVDDGTTAIGVLAAARDAGIVVPRDVSVIGYHETVATAMVRPRLTVVRMPMYELGSRAVTMLDAIVDGEFVPSGVVEGPAPRVIAGETTAAP
ncbi:LacI family DNA-binding transcriptional regulator [Phytoactinopolyspora halotolerans]|uniref:LacI family DNA-binding transcriptional regulator n=1 Tax=Phytoactinopolyspora halotolerans TaxID=1981512 RepID=UPI0028A81D3F|nr:LacI family DNA-binding transcriptional regulator [Phytoactinopolyspora halotolerans]